MAAVSMTAPASLYTGSEGSAAAEEALKTAQALLCATGDPAGRPCGTCRHCQKFEKRIHPDLILMAPDEKGSIKIESVREIGRRLSVNPLEASRVVVVILEADQLTEGAANALLKTLEEPPPFVHFLLVSAIPESLPATIRSRCRRVSFASPPRTDLRERYAATLADFEATVIARLNSPPSFSTASRIAEEIAAEPQKIPELLDLLRAWWHDLAVSCETDDDRFLLFPQAAATLAAWVAGPRRKRVHEDLDLIGETERAFEGNVNKTLLLERLFFRLMEAPGRPS